MGEFNNAFYSAATIRIIKKSIENVTVWILKIRAFYKKTKKPRKILQGVNLPEVGIEQSAQEPRKQGLLSDGDNADTQFGTHPNYFSTIIDLFDKLEADEQDRLISILLTKTQNIRVQ